MTARGITPARYNALAMVLHWTIAVLILTNIGIAWYFGTLHGLAKIPPTQLHKSVGITVLLLSLVRLAWRFLKPPPPLPGYVRGWERTVAGIVYVLFYGFMIAQPLTGWAQVSASRLIHVYPILPGIPERSTLFSADPPPANRVPRPGRCIPSRFDARVITTLA